MNINLCTILPTGHIGRDKFIVILKPLFTINKFGEYGHSIRAELNLESNFFRKHSKDIESILMKNGFVKEDYDFTPDGDRYSPDYTSFISHVNELLCDNSSIDNPFAFRDSAYLTDERLRISYMIYEMLHNDNEIIDDIIQNMVEYLIDKMSVLFIFTISYRYNEPFIQIENVKDYIINEYINEYEKMLAELGFPVAVPGQPNTSGFITYVENYINNREYINDAFNFGEALLRKINAYIVKLDWF